MEALAGEFTQNEKWSVKGQLMGECWYKDCCVSEHQDSLRCGKPEVEGGSLLLLYRTVIQSCNPGKMVLTENCKYAKFKSSSNTMKRNSSGKETYREPSAGGRRLWRSRELALE